MAVQVSKLSNGMTVVTDPMNHLASATLGVWVRTGSRSETEEENGISHLLEHMAFKGTKRRSAARIAEEIEAVGGEVNAATSIESTSYYARVLAEDVPLAIDILADILQESLLDPEELEREKHVIRQEIGAVHDTPEDMVFDELMRVTYPDQPIGRPILGTSEMVTGFSADNIRSYLDRNYLGPNSVLAAAGKVDHRSLVKAAERAFRKLGDEAAPVPQEAIYKGGEWRSERELMEAQVVLGFKGPSYHDPDFFTAQIAAGVLGGGMSSRLFQEIREKRGLCYSIYSFNWAFTDSGLFGIHAATGEDDTENLVNTTLDELMRAGDNLTDKEVARAKAQIRAGLLMTLEAPTARAGQIARNIMFYGRILPLDEVAARIEAISTADVKAFIGGLPQRSAPSLATIGPVSRVPDLASIAARIGAPLPPA